MTGRRDTGGLSAVRRRIWIGGVHLHIGGWGADDTWAREESARVDGVLYGGPGEHFATVDCSVEVIEGRGRVSQGGAPVRIEHGAAGLHVKAGTDELELCRTGSRRYRAEALVRSGSISGLATAAAWGALYLEGGMIFHAAVVEHNGGAIAFTGPSGAGKTTAAGLVAGARLLAADRAAVYRIDGGWWVAPVPGGSAVPVGLPSSTRRCVPLRAVARAVRGTGVGGAFRASSDRASALAEVRAALLCPAGAREEVVLDSAAALARDVWVGKVGTVLGRALSPEALPRADSRRQPARVRDA